MTQYKSIVVAVDGSKEAEYALNKAIEVAKRNPEAKLNLVNIIDTRSFAAIEAYDGSITERAQSYATKLLDDYKKKADDAGIQQINTIIEFGSPKTMITKEVSKSVEADLIICGATGLNAMERFLIGSVSEAIVRSSKCDVLVVRKPVIKE